MKLGRMTFLERENGIAFWIMFLSYAAISAYSYAISLRINYILLFMFIVAIIVAKFAWLMFASQRPLNVDVEKAERVAFWVMSLISLGVLTLEYATTRVFEYYVFYVFVEGLLVKYLLLSVAFLHRKI